MPTWAWGLQTWQERLASGGSPGGWGNPSGCHSPSVFIFFMEFLESKLTALVGCHVSLCTWPREKACPRMKQMPWRFTWNALGKAGMAATQAWQKLLFFFSPKSRIQSLGVLLLFGTLVLNLRQISLDWLRGIVGRESNALSIASDVRLRPQSFPMVHGTC